MPTKLARRSPATTHAWQSDRHEDLRPKAVEAKNEVKLFCHSLLLHQFLDEEQGDSIEICYADA